MYQKKRENLSHPISTFIQGQTKQYKKRIKRLPTPPLTKTILFCFFFHKAPHNWTWISYGHYIILGIQIQYAFITEHMRYQKTVAWYKDNSTSTWDWFEHREYRCSDQGTREFVELQAILLTISIQFWFTQLVSYKMRLYVICTQRWQSIIDWKQWAPKKTYTENMGY